MIEPKPWDKGRKVIFRPRKSHSLGGFKSADEYASEEGVFYDLGWNRDTVLVKFPTENEPRPVKARMLSWKDE